MSSTSIAWDTISCMSMLYPDGVITYSLKDVISPSLSLSLSPSLSLTGSLKSVPPLRPVKRQQLTPWFKMKEENVRELCVFVSLRVLTTVGNVGIVISSSC